MLSIKSEYQVDDVDWNIEIAGFNEEQKTNAGDGSMGSIIPIPVRLFSGCGQSVDLVGPNVWGEPSRAVSVLYTKLEQASFPSATAG